MKLKAVLFDLDGTLRDNRDMLYESFRHTVRETTGRTMTNNELYEYLEHHTLLHKAVAPDTDLAEFEQHFHSKFKELLPEVQLFEHTVEVLEQLHKRGLKLAIVSSAITVEDTLNDFDLAKYFDIVVSGKDPVTHKPSPEPVMLALERLNLRPDEVVMVGDMSADVLAAHGAGVPTVIALTHGLHRRETLQQAGADHIIDSLAELPSVLGKL
jgi:pyrophosphatase PpaX